MIGSPVRHSLSPALHNAGFAATGVDWLYTAFEVAPGEAAAALDAMRVLGLGGLSVTMPHKESVADLVDELDPAAAALHSVNTVVPLGDGRLKGYSTDGPGFVASLTASDVKIAGMHIGVLGAGGAARAIIDAIARAGAAHITVINRSPQRAVDAAALAPGIAVVGRAEAIRDCDIVVNATSVGMGSTELPLDIALLDKRQVVADIVYHPRCTALLSAAAGLGRAPSKVLECSFSRQSCSSSCGPASAPMRPSCARLQSGSWHRGASSLHLMLRYLTAGESHGQALVVIVEGLPAGLSITVEEIQAEMARRRLGFGRGPRQKFEQDELTLLGGVRHGRTLGSPVAIEIKNSEWFRSDKWHEEMSPAPGATKDPLTQVRPGHADLVGMQKYGFTDARDVLERASARETAARVAAGAVVKKLLSELGVSILSHVIQMGAVRSKAVRATDARRPGEGRRDHRCAASIPLPRRR